MEPEQMTPDQPPEDGPLQDGFEALGDWTMPTGDADEAPVRVSFPSGLSRLRDGSSIELWPVHSVLRPPAGEHPTG